MLGILEKSKICALRLHSLKCLSSRYLSTKHELVGNVKKELGEHSVAEASDPGNSITTGRRFVSLAKTPELKLYPDNFVYNLLAGIFDKKVFEYPEGVGEKEIETVLRHGEEIENILNSTDQHKLTEDVIKRLKRAEAFGVSVPKEYGGPGYTKRESTMLQESFGVDPKLGRILTYNDIGARILNLHGTEEQKKKYLPKIASGECTISLAYLEDCPAIDLASYEGFAIRDEVNNGFLITANKKWVHNADISDLFLVLAKSTLYAKDNIHVCSDVFIVEKNTPGVKVKKLNNHAASEFGLYDVSFKDVQVEPGNLLGKVNNAGHKIVQSILAETGFSHSVLCCSLMKKLLFAVTQYCQQKQESSKPLLNFEYIKSCISQMGVYTFAVESAVYMNAGRLDIYSGPHLFLESILTQILSVDMLQACIDKYIKITGTESLLTSGLLEQALKDAHYYSTLDENVIHLKLMIGGGGFIYAHEPLNKKFKVLRAKYDHPWEVFKLSLLSPEKKLKLKEAKHQVKMDLHMSLQTLGDKLDSMLAKLETAVETHWTTFPNNPLEDESLLAGFAEMTAYIHGVTACLSRASSSICNDIKNWQQDAKMAAIFTDLAYAKINQLFIELTQGRYMAQFESEIGELSFRNKHYPSEHPLTRTY